MLTIRKQQMAVFRNLFEESFVRKAVDHLNKNHVELVGHLSAKSLEQRIRFGIQKGREHGLTLESSLMGFVLLMFQIGPDFYEHPSIGDTLASPDTTENERVLMVYDSVSFIEWRLLRQSVDESKWPNSPDSP